MANENGVFLNLEENRAASDAGRKIFASVQENSNNRGHALL